MASPVPAPSSTSLPPDPSSGGPGGLAGASPCRQGALDAAAEGFARGSQVGRGLAHLGAPTRLGTGVLAELPREMKGVRAPGRSQISSK